VWSAPCPKNDMTPKLRTASAALLFGTGACRGGAGEWRAGFVDAPVSAVASQIAGRVDSVAVREGDPVKKGEVLAELDAKDSAAAVAQAQANLDASEQALAEAQANLTATTPTERGASSDIEKARAAVTESEIDYNRTERLVQSRAIAQSELDTNRSRLDQAKATLASAMAARAGTTGKVAAAVAAVENARAEVQSSQAALERARVLLAQSHILSPFDGVVVERDVEPGEWAAPGTPVVTVEDLSRAWVRLDVSEGAFGEVKLGAAADVRVLARPGRTFRGHVAQIGAEGDFALDRDVKRGRPDLRTFMVRVAFDEAADAVPGMTAEVRLGPVGSSGEPAPNGRAEASP